MTLLVRINDQFAPRARAKDFGTPELEPVARAFEDAGANPRPVFRWDTHDGLYAIRNLKPEQEAALEERLQGLSAVHATHIGKEKPAPAGEEKYVWRKPQAAQPAPARKAEVIQLHTREARKVAL